MQSYIVRLINLADQLKDFDEQCSESEKLYVLLNGLDETYEHIKSAIEIQKSITFDETCDFLISYYEKQILTGKLKQNSENKVLLTHQDRNRNFRKPKCSICHRMGHTEAACNKRAGKSKINEKNTSKVKIKQYCKYCVMTNHNSDD